MKGYVINKSAVYTHAMKRSIGPGGKIDLGELYEQYGIKHGINEGEEFVAWLREVKLKDRDKWQIIVEDGKPKTKEVTPDEAEKTKTQLSDNVAPMVSSSKHTVKDVVLLSVRKARDVIPTITDINLLKYALQEANQLAGKDTLCIILRKRIREIQSLR